MPVEQHIPYSERTATVIGGDGKMGKKIVDRLENLGFGDVLVCERGDRFSPFVRRSTDLFFAVDADTTTDLLRWGKRHLKPSQTVMDGSSVKTPRMVRKYRELDRKGVSVATTHLGVAPDQPWQGAKVWLSEVGENTQNAMRLAIDLYAPAQTSLRVINLAEHKKVEQAQSLTIISEHVISHALKALGMTLEDFNRFAPLTAELQAWPIARVLGQGSQLSAEIVSEQPLKKEFSKAISVAIKEFRSAQRSPRELQRLMQANEEYHNAGNAVTSLYDRAGVIAARQANLRLHSISIIAPENVPGELGNCLVVFSNEGANLTAIDSMPVSTGESSGGDRVRFDIGIDPSTIDDEKETRIKSNLAAMGFTVL